MPMPFVVLTAVSHLAFKSNFHTFSSAKEDPKFTFIFQWKLTTWTILQLKKIKRGTWNNIQVFMCTFNFLLAPKTLLHAR